MDPLTLETLMQQTPQPPRPRRQGLVIVNTGDGKGKSSAALGVTFRALGWNWNVRIIQFIKGQWTTGEQRMAQVLPLNIDLHALGDGFTWDTQNPEQDRRTTWNIWEFAKQSLFSQEHDLLVLDEINYVFDLNYLDVEPVLQALKQRPSWLHVICTGRGAPQPLIDYADLVTEMRMIKHPFKSGLKAQRGIEF